MGRNKPRNPFAGKHVAPTSNSKATRLPGKKRQAAANNNGGGNKPKKKDRSFWGLVAAGAGFAALWAWNVLSRVQQSRSDDRTLAAMLQRPLAITDHAACRMDCRFISRSDILEMLRQGRINVRKSQPTLTPCPKYTVDAAVASGGGVKNVQGVFAACPTETRVVTVIDTDTNWACGPC